MTERFAFEARVLASLSHPAIVGYITNDAVGLAAERVLAELPQ